MAYEIILADPPWPYSGSTTKNAAAGKHYSLMTIEEIKNFKLPKIKSKCALFLWATSPKLNLALDVMQEWGFHYRGVAWVWVKTRKDGTIISGQGIRPTFTKPTSEYLLVGSTNKNGRPFPILDESVGQIVLTPRRKHSEKPAIFHELITTILGNRPRIELFARKHTDGWDAWGNEIIPVENYKGE